MLTQKSHWYLIVVCRISNNVTNVGIEPMIVIKKSVVNVRNLLRNPERQYNRDKKINSCNKINVGIIISHITKSIFNNDSISI